MCARSHHFLACAIDPRVVACGNLLFGCGTTNRAGIGRLWRPGWNRRHAPAGGRQHRRDRRQHGRDRMQHRRAGGSTGGTGGQHRRDGRRKHGWDRGHTGGTGGSTGGSGGAAVIASDARMDSTADGGSEGSALPGGPGRTAARTASALRTARPLEGWEPRNPSNWVARTRRWPARASPNTSGPRRNYGDFRIFFQQVAPDHGQPQARRDLPRPAAGPRRPAPARLGGPSSSRPTEGPELRRRWHHSSAT